MNKDYISINGSTIISDEKGMHKKETHNSIGVELELENEIEIIEINIACLNQEKDKLGTVEENKKFKKGSYIFVALMFIFVIALCKWIIPVLVGFPEIEIPNARFSFIKTNMDALLCTMLPACFIMLAPIIGKEILGTNSKIKRIQTIEEQLEFLNNELSQKKAELEEIRKISKKESITDTTIHSIDNSKYRASLKERLAILAYIKKYRNKLKTYLAKGNLIEELRGLEIQPEDIPFAETALKRVLEKEKSYSQE
ncbi:MAG: hypothetical protein HFI49_04685 [Bacilli bacterium]|jgi:hypothetical protein|nr:hypothetical protein [Bacilli bacterium]